MTKKETTSEKKAANTDVSSKDISLALISKMIKYQHSIDKKENPTEAEKRHRDYLRSFLKK